VPGGGQPPSVQYLPAQGASLIPAGWRIVTTPARGGQINFNLP